MIKTELLNNLSEIIKNYLTENSFSHEELATLLVDQGGNPNISSRTVANWSHGKSLPKDFESKQAISKLITGESTNYSKLTCDASIAKTIFINSVKEVKIKYMGINLDKIKATCINFHGHPPLLDIAAIKVGFIGRSEPTDIMCQIMYFCLKEYMIKQNIYDWNNLDLNLKLFFQVMDPYKLYKRVNKEELLGSLCSYIEQTKIIKEDSLKKIALMVLLDNLAF
ncbi:hypothetical protein PT287_08495 [Lactobacillus sp. ESL0679]|uniref:hypothetical protein n=1 Tax=Lactobacillus sp. ESL0679 TaxID=2983209 RepID=UPI0023F7149B|nr:hypothetical protein [Lactobacillus sp. ESL0679]MDF7683534.1 hypothetical protein [Lactobacillus sp. ESL0679]